MDKSSGPVSVCSGVDRQGRIYSKKVEDGKEEALSGSARRWALKNIAIPNLTGRPDPAQKYDLKNASWRNSNLIRFPKRPEPMEAGG